MPRKAFNADVKAASEQVIAGITDVGRGDDDGDVNACYTPGTGSPIELGLLVTPGKSALFLCLRRPSTFYA
jgi:ubiquitin-conjugating enzyme E2 Q